MKLFMAGQDVPEWLLKVYQTDESKPYKHPEVKFDIVSVVYVQKGFYVARPLIGHKHGSNVFRVDKGLNCTIQGQSPGRSDVPVLIIGIPVLSYGEVMLLVLLTVLVSFFVN